MKLVFLILLFIIPRLSLVAQEKEGDSLKFLLEIKIAITDSFFDSTSKFAFVISNKINEDTVYTHGENISKLTLSPNTDYQIKSYYIDHCAEFYALGQTIISTKGRTNPTKFIEEIYSPNFKIDYNIYYEIVFKFNKYKKPMYLYDYEKSPIQETFKLIQTGDLKSLTITGYRKENESENISRNRAKHFKNKLIKLGIEKSKISIEDGGTTKEQCPTYIELEIIY